MARPDQRQQIAALDALYAELPSIDCQGLCGEACSHIMMSTTERQRIVDSGGPEIVFTQSPCHALDFIGRCSVYEHRPLICRLWGVVDDMPCHYGCEPERYLTRKEGFEFLARVQEITGDPHL
jgi:Fe-S-cluster containining protein